jgi:ABC-2 type transport system permease protein
MSKIPLIIRREYFNRIKNKTFLILTFLAPVFYGLLLVLPILTANLGKQKKEILLDDCSGLFAHHLGDNHFASFKPVNLPYADVPKLLNAKEGAEYVLYIPDSLNIYHPAGVQLLSRRNVGAGFQEFVDSALSGRIKELKMERMNIARNRLDSLTTKVDVQLRTVTARGVQTSSSVATTIAAVIGGFLIYIFIFLYGGLVLRGVQEEKQNRIVEIIISSVKPFELMIGKILGIALVGLTQFIIWIVLTLVFTTLSAVFIGGIGHQAAQVAAQTGQSGGGEVFQHILAAINTLNIPLLIIMFIFYFFGGYLLYSSMFAAFAAAVDTQTDIYQFMFPLSLPIVVSISMIPGIIDNPDSSLAVWLSIIPLTSPVIMMARLPFIEPGWQLFLSVVLLIAGFLLSTWLAGRIYRVGILLYGKKTTYKEILRWLFY